MPKVFASSAAVTGAISPRLFSPSVSRITTLLMAVLSFRRETAVANPFPMAVPSSIIPLSIFLKRLITVAWSVVSGHCVKLSPEKMTSPILSFGRPEINLVATSFAASIRFGWKSIASIELEISRAMMISIPSVVTFCQLFDDCGRARAIIRNDKPSI